MKLLIFLRQPHEGNINYPFSIIKTSIYTDNTLILAQRRFFSFEKVRFLGSIVNF